MSAQETIPQSQGGLCALLTWKDPIKTGKVFGSILLGLFVFKVINLFNIVFHLAYFGLLATAAAEYAGKLITGKGFVTKYKPGNKTFAKHFNEQYLPSIASFNEKAEEELQKVVYAHDIETTLKAAGISYVLYKLTSWLSLFTLITIAVVSLFTIPYVYQSHKEEIDTAVAQYSKVAKDKSAELYKTAQDKASPHVETALKKLGPVGDFVKAKFPTRTAGSTVGETATYDEPTSATSSGAARFPEVPTEQLKSDSTFEDLVDEAKTQAGSVPNSF